MEYLSLSLSLSLSHSLSVCLETQTKNKTGFLAPDSHIWNVVSTLFLEIDRSFGHTQSTDRLALYRHLSFN